MERPSARQIDETIKIVAKLGLKVMITELDGNVLPTPGPGGASRLVGYGRWNTTSELEKDHQQLKVPMVQAMIDSGFKASEVYWFCMATSWITAAPGRHQ